MDMTTNAASEQELGNLHNKVAKVMVRALNQFEKAQDVFDATLVNAEDNPDSIMERPEISPALLGVMTKFLNENKITCTPEQSESMSELEKTLADKRTRRRPRRQVGNVVHMDPFEDE